MSTEAMKLAIEALRKARRKSLTFEECNATITLLNNALAKQEQGEPVAWMDSSGHPKHLRHIQNSEERRLYGELQPLYLHPQQKQEIEQEPVAWMSNESAYRLKHGGNNKGAVPVHAKKTTVSKIPLYTTPQQRTWVGLTDEEIMEMLDYGQYGRVPQYARNFVDAIETKLKEKNA